MLSEEVWLARCAWDILCTCLSNFIVVIHHPTLIFSCYVHITAQIIGLTAESSPQEHSYMYAPYNLLPVI